MYGVTVSRRVLRAFRPRAGALALIAAGAVFLPAELSAQDRKIEQFGTVLQALLPLAGAFCAYRQSDVDDYSTRFVLQPERDTGAPLPAEQRDVYSYGHTQPTDDLSFIAGREAAVSGAEYLNRHCISGLPSRTVVGGLAALANASEFVFKDQEVGLFSMGSLVGFRNENLKFKVSRHSVKLKFSLDF